MFRNQFMEAEKHKAPLWIVILLLAALIGSGYFIFENLIAPTRLADRSHLFYFLFLATLGIIACTVLSQYLAKKYTAQFFQALGIFSLQIYLVHMLAGVGMRMVLLHGFGIQNWVVHIIIGVTFAPVMPIILQKISEKLNFPYLFELRRNSS